MANNFYGSICLTDIPKRLITTGRNGKKYLNVVVNERREVGQYGQTHYIKAYARKDAVPPGTNLYIGELKPSEYGNDGLANNGGLAKQSTNEQPSLPMPSEDDLPF